MKNTGMMTLRQAYEAYLCSHDLREGTKISYDRRMHIWLSDWLDRPLSEILKEDLGARHAQVAKTIRDRGTHDGETTGKHVIETLKLVVRSAGCRI